MTGKIITSAKKKKSRPRCAFLLSFFFTGLGEIYNGELSRGAVLFAVKIFSLLAGCLYVLSRRPDSCAAVFIIQAVAFTLISIASPVYAALMAAKQGEVQAKKYTGPFFIIPAAVFNLLITGAALFIFFSFFDIRMTGENELGPFLSRGDIILVLKYRPEGFSRGELAVSGTGRIVRIMASGGDTAAYQNNAFTINNIPLTNSIFADAHIYKKSLDPFEDLIAEINNEKKYPIRSKIYSSATHHARYFNVKKGFYLAVQDNRLEEGGIEEISADAIAGRVEGILFSPNFKKIMLKSFYENFQK